MATPLDDRIEVFKNADNQSEAMVVQLLKVGVAENRAPEALSTVRSWLSANTATSQGLYFYAGRAMHYAGDWSDAVIFYRKLLKSDNVDAKLAGTVVPEVYRLLINDMRDDEAAYLFMREEGNRLRKYGRAKQFDHWFLRKALARNDLRAAADRLVMVYTSGEAVSDYTTYLDQVESKLESFEKRDDATVKALDRLGVAVATRKPIFKARWNWINAVSRYNAVATQISSKRGTPDKELLSEPLAAAKALVAVDPIDGAALIAKGWSRWAQSDTPTFYRFVHVHRELKGEVFVSALQRLSFDQAKKMLNAGAQGPRNRWVAVAGFISPAQARKLAPRFPKIFNSLDAPPVPLWDKAMSVADAKALAPYVARNPRSDAALVRGLAAAGDKKGAAVLEAIAKSESWRFGREGKTSGPRRMVDTIWNCGLDHSGLNRDASVKKYEADFKARNGKFKTQISKDADTKSRLTAFASLYTELRGTLSTPALVGLWQELMQQAPDADRVVILKKLTSDFISATGDKKDLQKAILSRAIRSMSFGNAYSEFTFGPAYDGGWDRWGYNNMRKRLPAFAAYLQSLLQQQMRAGAISKEAFGMWLHCVQPKDAKAQALMKEMVKSPAYATLGPAYHQMAAHRLVFGSMALTDASRATDPRRISRELVSLPKGASPAQVGAALQAVVTRASHAPEPVLVVGLQQVAALPSLDGATRVLVLALFDQLSPLGNYPERAGYEQLALRIIKDARSQKNWGSLVPYASSLWRTDHSPDDARRHPVAEAMTSFAEAAFKAGQPSATIALARSGLRSGIPGLQGELRGRLNAVAGKAAVAVGVVEIKADTTDPTYPIHKSSSEFIQGNLDSAWKLYVENAELLKPKPDAGDEKPLLRQLPVSYALWLLQRNVEEGRRDDAEWLVRELTIWSRQESGLLSLEQEANLKITLADLAFLKGALPTARAWYRKVADAREYRGSPIQVRAALGSVNVDRVSKNFGAALEELDKLMRVKDPESRSKVRYAKAEVLMDQENYKDAFSELDAVLRHNPNHEDAKILRGKIEIRMRRLVEATEIELGVSREDKVMVPGEVLKVNLFDPTLSVSGVGADIEIEVWAKSGDRERVMLHQLGDNKDRFRADVPTVLGPPVAGDKTLQVLGEDEIRYGYSKRFRAKMKDLPPDPDTVITIASDASLAFAAGAFPPRKGERKLSIDELGLSSAQAKLGRRMVRPGNPVYLRVIDPDQSKTAQIDAVPVRIETSSGDVIRRLLLKETGPYTGEFEAVIPTTGAQASAFASEMVPGRDPNMAISAKAYPGWLGKVGHKDRQRIFGVDFNDNVPVDKMRVEWLAADQAVTHFVLQTSLNGKQWVTCARYPADTALWVGAPLVTSFPTYGRNFIAVSKPKGYGLPSDWREKMELLSAAPDINYKAVAVSGLASMKPELASGGHPAYTVLMRFRAAFYQPSAAERTFQLKGYPGEDGTTLFLLDGKPTAKDSDAPFTITRELRPGLHEIEVWSHQGRDKLESAKPVLLCDVDGKDALQPCPDSMFDPAQFPEGVRAQLPQPATVTKTTGGLEIAFGDKAQARLVRMSIHGFSGVAPGIKRMTLTGRDGKAYLPVQQDFMALRDNKQLEVLPGDSIIARYEDPMTATPGRDKHEGRLGVAFNTGTISASFLNYEMTPTGRELKLEPIRRFNLEDAVAIVVDDVDMDGSPERDYINFVAITSSGQKTKLKAVETEEHSGRFVGRIFPVTGTPQRASELQVPEGGTLTLVYLDSENLDPGIPTLRKVTIEHAKYVMPKLGAYTVSSKLLPQTQRPANTTKKPTHKTGTRAIGPETFEVRRSLSYSYVDEANLTKPLNAIIGGSMLFDVVIPHLALANSSEITAYVQTDAGRRMAAEAPDAKPLNAPFDISVPGTLKLTGSLHSRSGLIPRGYKAAGGAGPGSGRSALEEGRFSFSVPLVLGERPRSSLATKSQEERMGAADNDGLVVQAGDTVYIGYAWKDEAGKVQWKTASAKVGSHAFLDVMNDRYNEALSRVFVGEKVFVRVLAPGVDRGSQRDWSEVSLEAGSGAKSVFKLRETEPHSGLFKGVFAISFADEQLPEKLPPVELNGFPVRYGDEVTVRYAAAGKDPEQLATVAINMGADGAIEPFSKRFTGDQMAVRTSFTLSECFFELAKKHRKMDQESLARREMGHAQKLLQEAIATHREDDLRAQAEYLLGNLAQEYADLAKNEESKLPMYQDALARFTKIPVDYPDTEFANKAQFKTALVYEKLGESEIAVEEYVKLAYKYPDSEHIPEAMSRLGRQFQKNGQAFKAQADPLREKEDVESQAEVLRLDELSYPEFIKAATIYGKLFERFPDHKLAGLAGLASAQNLMRAHRYDTAIERFKKVVDNEDFDDNDIRAQALYWSGLSNERIAAAAGSGDYKRAGTARQDAYQTYRRVTFDFPDSKWAKYARGRLADPTFAKTIEIEKQTRDSLLEALKYQKKKRSQDRRQKQLMDKLREGK